MFKSEFLRRRLVWPLSAAAVLCFGLATLIPAGGLFVNLGTTFVGILLTIGYVDIILTEHQRIRWAGALLRIGSRLDNFATIASSQFRIAFGFKPDVYDQGAMAAEGKARRAELARVARQVLRPVAKQRIEALDTAGWKRLQEQLRMSWNSADRLIDVFGAQLDPETIATVMDIQDRMRAIMESYTTFPDLLGVPDGELRPNRRGESSLPLRRALEKAAAEDVCVILDKSADLFEHVNRMERTRPAA